MLGGSAEEQKWNLNMRGNILAETAEGSQGSKVSQEWRQKKAK